MYRRPHDKISAKPKIVEGLSVVSKCFANEHALTTSKAAGDTGRQ